MRWCWPLHCPRPGPSTPQISIDMHDSVLYCWLLQLHWNRLDHGCLGLPGLIWARGIDRWTKPTSSMKYGSDYKWTNEARSSKSSGSFGPTCQLRHRNHRWAGLGQDKTYILNMPTQPAEDLNKGSTHWANSSSPTYFVLEVAYGSPDPLG